MKKQLPFCISCHANYAPPRKNFCYKCEQIEVKAKKREYMREYQQKPEVKAKKREYQQKPEVKAKKREYQQKPEVKAKQREYTREYQTVRESKKAIKKIYNEYNILLQKMDKQTLNVREMRRLEALAEYLGRDIDEWRTEQQKKEYHEKMSEKY